MTATVTTNFRLHNARQFVESLSETANDVYYMFIGKPTSWKTGDDNVESPDDSVANSSFEYWNDIISFRRITSDDLIYVTPRYNWTSDTKYSMFDHRNSMSSMIANTAGPFYVLTQNNEVFKCIYNGRSNNSSDASNSTSEPSISGQPDINTLTYADGSPNDYIWKYMFTISEDDATKYLTSNYMPVKDLFTSLNANNDVDDDGSNQYNVFNTSRISGNGTIYKVIVEEQGSGYTNIPSVTINGDGTGIDAVATISSGKVSDIILVNGGLNYSYANVVITANGDSGSGATATAIISPRMWLSNGSGITYKTNHGINAVDELAAKNVMLYVEFDGVGESGLLSIGNDYRRVGIIRNPHLYGTSNVATANVYSQTTDLVLSSISGTFLKDEIVWQGSTNAYGVVVEMSGSTLKLVNIIGSFSNSGTTTIIGIGNGNTTGMVANSSITIPPLPTAFTPTIPSSSASANISSIELPDINPYSGTILYIDHRTPITRSISQTEIVRTILSF